MQQLLGVGGEVVEALVHLGLEVIHRVRSVHHQADDFAQVLALACELGLVLGALAVAAVGVGDFGEVAGAGAGDDLAG